MRNIVVIGGGPSGMMAAGIAAERGSRVTLFEKKDRPGRKLFITGKGRCNLTNASDVETILANIPGNPYFLYSSLYSFDSTALVGYFNDLGIKTKVERGNRVFPQSEKSGDIVRALEENIKKLNVEVVTNTPVTEVLLKDGGVAGVGLTMGRTCKAEAVIIATGGLSYPVTGSTGDGYRFALDTGHRVTPQYPSLVGLRAKEDWVTGLQGLSLKNVAITARANQQVVYTDFGEMLFTHTGISGPMILSASRFLTKLTDAKREVIIDLKPALSEKELDNRLLRDFTEAINKDFQNALDGLLPQRLIPVIIELSQIPPHKKIHDITREERMRLLRLLKGLTVEITRTEGYDQAVITTGGVCVDDINPSTMESKLVRGLYFTGEVIDIDALTGGFNLQLAFSTGYLAGMSAAQNNK